jgi:hypothetical protein
MNEELNPSHSLVSFKDTPALFFFAGMKADSERLQSHDFASFKVLANYIFCVSEKLIGCSKANDLCNVALSQTLSILTSIRHRKMAQLSLASFEGHDKTT